MNYCTLKDRNMLDESANCKPEECRTCGWNRIEAIVRKEYIKKNGLKNVNGKQAVVLPKEWV